MRAGTTHTPSLKAHISGCCAGDEGRALPEFTAQLINATAESFGLESGQPRDDALFYMQGLPWPKIAGCYAFWAWLRLGKSFFWLIPGMLALADAGQTEFNAQIDALVTAGVRVTTCIGIAQQIGSEAVFHDRNIALLAELTITAVKHAVSPQR